MATPGTSMDRDGRPGWNRTSNPQLRRLMLYPIELRAHRRLSFARAATCQLIIANQGADWATLLGGSPRIYAGEGALQRSGKRSALVTRFSAGYENQG